VVLALSDEGDELVGPYVDDLGLRVRVGSGSHANSKYGVKGYPSAVLIDPQGDVAWAGHPSGLSKGAIKDALKGARPLPSASFLACRVERELSRALSSAVKAAEEGKLGKALLAARKVAADERAEAADKEDAEYLAGELEAYVALLRGQAESFLKDREVLTAMEVFEALADDLRGSELGDAIAARVEEIRKDDSLQLELEAAEALVKAHDLAARRTLKKAAGKYEALVKKYAGTKAAERAAMILRKI